MSLYKINVFCKRAFPVPWTHSYLNWLSIMGLTVSFYSYIYIYRNRAGGVIRTDHVRLYCCSDWQSLQVPEGRVRTNWLQAKQKAYHSGENVNNFSGKFSSIFSQPDILGWPKSLFAFCYIILWKNPSPTPKGHDWWSVSLENKAQPLCCPLSYLLLNCLFGVDLSCQPYV